MIAYWERGLEWMGEGLQLAICPSFTGPTSLQALDVSGRSSHGTLTFMDRNTSWQTSGGKGALSFDGVDDYVLLPSGPAYRPASGDRFSVSAWVFTNSSTGNKAILSHGNPNGYSFYIQGNFLELAKAGVANTGSSASLTPIVIGAWNHVAVTNTVNSRVQLWINGALRRDVAFVQTYAYLNQLRIGDSQNETGLFNGSIDDVRFYDRLLTAPEVRQLYDLGRGGGMLYQPPRRRSVFIAAGFRAYWHRRQQQLIGGGL